MDEVVEVDFLVDLTDLFSLILFTDAVLITVIVAKVPDTIIRKVRTDSASR